MKGAENMSHDSVKFTMIPKLRGVWVEIAYEVEGVRVCKDVDERGPYFYLCDYTITKIEAFSDRQEKFVPVSDRLRKVLEKKDIEFHIKENLIWKIRGW